VARYVDIRDAGGNPFEPTPFGDESGPSLCRRLGLFCHRFEQPDRPRSPPALSPSGRSR
jgi:hypothetical protein